MGSYADRTNALAATAVGDAERLVQVEVADVGAECSRLGESHHGVEVGTVEVHLAACVMDHFADASDFDLEHAVGRG